MSANGIAAAKPPASAADGRSLVPLAIAAGLGLIVLCGLGFWQLQRGAQKQAFIARITQAIAASPKTDWTATDAFERVRLQGRLEPESTVFVRVTLPEGLGVYVMTPLLVDGTRTRVFVNRGFVKTAQDGRPLAVETSTEATTVTGLRREAEPRGWFATATNAATRSFAVRDPRDFARVLDLDAVESDYLEAEPAPGRAEPNGIDPRKVIARIPDNHLSYAFTWFGLAATLVGVFAALVVGRRRETRT
jgi:surfeit locus 1 family protein